MWVTLSITWTNLTCCQQSGSLIDWLIDWLVDWLPGGVGGLHLVWVPAVGPEEEQPVEQRLDVGHVGFPLGKDPEDAAVLLNNNKDQLMSVTDEIVLFTCLEINVKLWNKHQIVFCYFTSVVFFTSAPTQSLTVYKLLIYKRSEVPERTLGFQFLLR